jgi:hypothetical protein
MYMENTEVPAHQSVAAIIKLLRASGATEIRHQYIPGSGELAGLDFVIMTEVGPKAYRMPARIQPIFVQLQERRKKKTPEGSKRDLATADRIAWRQLFRWLEAQMALVDLNMAEPGEVFFAWLLSDDGSLTMYEHWKGRLLEAPKEAARRGSQVHR